MNPIIFHTVVCAEWKALIVGLVATEMARQFPLFNVPAS